MIEAIENIWNKTEGTCHEVLSLTVNWFRIELGSSNQDEEIRLRLRHPSLRGIFQTLSTYISRDPLEKYPLLSVASLGTLLKWFLIYFKVRRFWDETDDTYAFHFNIKISKFSFFSTPCHVFPICDVTCRIGSFSVWYKP